MTMTAVKTVHINGHVFFVKLVLLVLICSHCEQNDLQAHDINVKRKNIMHAKPLANDSMHDVSHNSRGEIVQCFEGKNYP